MSWGSLLLHETVCMCGVTDGALRDGSCRICMRGPRDMKQLDLPHFTRFNLRRGLTNPRRPRGPLSESLGCYPSVTTRPLHPTRHAMSPRHAMSRVTGPG